MLANLFLSFDNLVHHKDIYVLFLTAMSLSLIFSFEGVSATLRNIPAQRRIHMTKKQIVWQILAAGALQVIDHYQTLDF